MSVGWGPIELRAAVVCVLLGCGVLQARADPAKPVEVASPDRLSGKVVTRSGNQLKGELLRLDCQGISIKVLGRAIVVPLDAIAAAASNNSVPVFLGSNGGRVNGKLLIRSDTVFVSSRELGKLDFPVAQFRCERDPADARIADRQASKVSSTPLSQDEMSRVTGLGPGPSDAKIDSAVTDAPAAPNDSQRPAAQSTQTDSPGTSPGMQNVAPGSTDQKKVPTPKEQQEENERNTLEFLRNEAVLTRVGQLESDLAIGYLHTNSLIGTQKIMTTTAVGRYGITRGLEGFLAVPGLYGQRQTFPGGQVISNEIVGIGDVKFGLKYNAVNESVNTPAIVLGLTGIAPTGRYPYLKPKGNTATVAGGDTRDPLNPLVGTGHWQIVGSVTALKSFDPIVLFATINYSHLFPASYYSVRVIPGDTFELNTGLGFGVNDRGTFSSQLFIDFNRKWSFNGVPALQTDTTPISLRFAYTHVVTTDDLIEPSVIFGVTRDATDAIVQLDWIHRF